MSESVVRGEARPSRLCYRVPQLGAQTRVWTTKVWHTGEQRCPPAACSNTASDLFHLYVPELAASLNVPSNYESLQRHHISDRCAFLINKSHHGMTAAQSPMCLIR